MFIHSVGALWWAKGLYSSTSVVVETALTAADKAADTDDTEITSSAASEGVLENRCLGEREPIGASDAAAAEAAGHAGAGARAGAGAAAAAAPTCELVPQEGAGVVTAFGGRV